MPFFNDVMHSEHTLFHFRLEIDYEQNIMYIYSMVRSCSLITSTGCVDDANFVTHLEYCSNDLCNNVVGPCFN